MQPLLTIAINAARQAGDIILRNADQLERIVVTPKGEKDVFCDIDVKAEQAIINAIRKAHPNHGIMAEESGIQQDDAEVVWIIDPLDGTKNYLHGYPFYSVSIAVRIKNRLEHAVVYDPLRHECFSASRGYGARLNDRRLRVSKQTQLNASILAVGFSNHNNSQNLPITEALVGLCAGIRRSGSVALDLAYVASGRLDGFYELGLQPWDIAAGCLLIQEAGGLVSDSYGDDNYLKLGDVVAGTPKVFKQLLQTIVAGNRD